MFTRRYKNATCTYCTNKVSVEENKAGSLLIFQDCRCVAHRSCHEVYTSLASKEVVVDNISCWECQLFQNAVPTSGVNCCLCGDSGHRNIYKISNLCSNAHKPEDVICGTCLTSWMFRTTQVAVEHVSVCQEIKMYMLDFNSTIPTNLHPTCIMCREPNFGMRLLSARGQNVIKLTHAINVNEIIMYTMRTGSFPAGVLPPHFQSCLQYMHTLIHAHKNCFSFLHAIYDRAGTLYPVIQLANALCWRKYGEEQHLYNEIETKCQEFSDIYIDLLGDD